MAWWANLQIDALREAKDLWAATLLQTDPMSNRYTANAPKQPTLGTPLEPPVDAERNAIGPANQ
jgi:hypothetical protein